MPVEIARAQPDVFGQCLERWEREGRSSFFGFHVIWHEQAHEFLATENAEPIGIAGIRIAASLAHIETLIVRPQSRRRGTGRALLEHAAETANYYNCHKMTVLVPYRSNAQAFFERCGFHEEAVLPQHTFKLDMAVLRKFLL